MSISLTLVDAVQGESALLLAENLSCSVEQRGCHGGTCSAAPVAQNEFSLNSAMPAAGVAIANQTQGQVEQSNPASLLVENSVSGGEVKAVCEGQSSAAPASSIEKWSSEALFTAEAITYGGRSAIAARSKARPVRMQKLKLAEVLRENPEVEFLAECWSDDPALQIVIRK